MGKVSFKGGAKAPAKKAAAKKTATKKSPAKKTSAKKTTKKTEEETSEEESTAIATRDTGHNPPAVPSAASGIDGEVDIDDIKLPRINVVNAMSDLHTEDEFPLGAIVLDKEVQLIDREGELEFVVLYCKPLYQQKLPYESKESPIVVSTKREVIEEGGTTEWSKTAMEEFRFFERLAHFVLAIKAPEDVDESELHRFPSELGGEYWGRVALTVNGSSFKSFGKNVITAGVGKLKQTGLHSGGWLLKLDKRSNEKGSWYVPVSKFAGMIDDEEALEFFAELAARGTEEDEA